VEAPQLRPLGVGDIVDRVFALYRGRPMLFLALAAIPYLIFFLIIGVLGVAFAATFISLGAFADLATARPTTAALTPALISALIAALVFGIIVMIVAIVIFSAQSA